MLPNELPLERHAGTLGGVLDHEAEIGQAVADAVGHGPHLLGAGGGAANASLRAALGGMAKRTHTRLFLPPLKLCGDNAAMIGAQGYYELLAGHTAGLDLNGRPYMDIQEGFKMRYEKVQMATFLARPNRFVALCLMFDGSIQDAIDFYESHE